MSRFVVNNSSDYNGTIPNQIIQDLRVQLPLLIGQIMNEYPPDSDFQLDSLGQKQRRYSMYSGSGGNVFFYYKLYMKYSKDYKEPLQESLAANLPYTKSESLNKISFVSGKSGLFAMAAVVTQQSKDLVSLCQEINLMPHSENE